MSMQYPVSDMFCCIKNALAMGKKDVTVNSTRFKAAIVDVLKNEGYIEDFIINEGVKPTLTIKLKYYNGKPVIETLRAISKPSLRIYARKDKLPLVDNGLGIAIISTSAGRLMTDREARKQGIGGEILCYVS